MTFKTDLNNKLEMWKGKSKKNCKNLKFKESFHWKKIDFIFELKPSALYWAGREYLFIIQFCWNNEKQNTMNACRNSIEFYQGT